MFILTLWGEGGGFCGGLKSVQYSRLFVCLFWSGSQKTLSCMLFEKMCAAQ